MHHDAEAVQKMDAVRAAVERQMSERERCLGGLAHVGALPLACLHERLLDISKTLENMAAQAGAHADRLHGEGLQEAGQCEARRPPRYGMIGNLDDAVDLLSDRVERLRAQIDRNCNIA